MDDNDDNDDDGDDGDKSISTTFPDNLPRRWNGLHERRRSWQNAESVSPSSTQTPVCPMKRGALCDDLQVVHYLPNEKRYAFCDLLVI